jgi:hypothetical protein
MKRDREGKGMLVPGQPLHPNKISWQRLNAVFSTPFQAIPSPTLGIAWQGKENSCLILFLPPPGTNNPFFAWRLHEER